MGGAGYEPAETPLWRQLLSYTIAGGLSLTIVGILLWDRHQRLSKLELELEKQVRTKNVIGNTTPDKFYERDGQRLYIEVDGRPAMEYFTLQTTKN